MFAPRNAVPVARSRSRVIWNNDQPWRCVIGFAQDGRPVHFEVTGRTRAAARAMTLAWRTTDDEWLGRYLAANGYVTARLSPTDIALIENTAKTVWD